MDEVYKKKREVLGQILEAARHYRGYDQKTLAKKLGVKQACISKTESGDRKIDVIQLMDYCEALGISLTELSCMIDSRFSSEFPVYKNSKLFLKSYNLATLQACIRLIKSINRISVFMFVTLLQHF